MSGGFVSVTGIVATFLTIILKIMGWKSDQDQRQIGRQEGTIEGFEQGKKNAELRTKIETDVGKLDPDGLRGRLSKWMRD